MIIILYDHNTYFLSSPVCQTCLIDLYREMTDQFRPELFDDSARVQSQKYYVTKYNLIGSLQFLGK
jgi:hypothetical protein